MEKIHILITSIPIETEILKKFDVSMGLSYLQTFAWAKNWIMKQV